ncbi:MAG: DUF1036 domain-containing protein [Variibacter sp.]
MNVIDSNILERDAGGKPLHTFPHPALMALAVFAAAMLSAAPAHADLQLCNRTSYIFDLALGLESKGATATQGWFRVNPGDCRTVLTGELNAEKVFVATRALPLYGSAPLVQTGGPQLCVANDNFIIAGAQKCPSGSNYLTPFNEVKPSEGNSDALTANIAEEDDYDAEQARLAGIQRLLVAAGYDANPIDGLEGKRTEAAIGQFVRDHGLSPDAQGKPAFFDALLAATRQEQAASFTWCNDTRYTVMAALGAEGKSSVATRGWYRIGPGHCTKPDEAADAKHLYSFAEAIDENGAPIAKGTATLAWGGSVILCTRDLKFEIDDQKDCSARGLRGTGFAPVDAGATVRFRE